MRRKLAAAVLGCGLVLVLFYQHGFLNKLLLPGFYFSAAVTVSDGRGYGKSYYVLGLVLNAAIFSSIIFGFFLSPRPRHDPRRLAMPLIAICLALCAFAIVYAPPVYAVVHTRWSVRNQPEMWVVPIALPEVPIEHSVGSTYSYYGYEFEVPWTQLKQERKQKSMTILVFANDSVVVFYDPEQEINELDIMKSAKDIFGDNVTSSRYAMRSRILSLTPNDLRLSWSRREMAANSALILLKPVYVGLTKSRIYSFRTEWFRGFQAGDPQTDKMTIVDAFDAQDHQIELRVGSREGAKKPSQGDVSRIIYSLHPTGVTSSR